MSVITISVCIVASALGAAAFWASVKAAAPGWLAFGLGVLVALLILSGGPGLLGGR